MPEEKENIENSKLLSLIDDWLKANGNGKTYENVVLELFNGNSFLYIQNYNQITETREFVADENTKLKLGIYEIAEKKYYSAFTDLDLLSKWMKVRGSYTKLPSKALLQIADENKMDGIIINTSYKNAFAVFRNADN